MIGNLKKCLGLIVMMTGLAVGVQGQPGFQVQIAQMGNAPVTRQQLQQFFRFYPPTFAETLRLDPSLLNNKDFMAPYPQLEAFLKDHPEVLRNPSFYLGEPSFNDDRPTSEIEQRARVMRNFMEPLSIVLVFGVVAGGIIFIIKTAVDYRRWSRISKMQAEVHSKILDRFTSSQDLLTYIETPAGRRFLESAPILTNGGGRMSAPFGRIVWSAQIGVIVGFAGLGLQYASTRFQDDMGEPFFVLGALGIAVGIGFIVSAIVAYATSRSLGLLNPTTTEKPPIEP